MSGAKGSFSEPMIAVQLGGKFMLYVMRLRAIAPGLCIAAALFLTFDASPAHAAKIKMFQPFPVATTACIVYPALTAPRAHIGF
jgi:hypothetical protein